MGTRTLMKTYCKTIEFPMIMSKIRPIYPMHPGTTLKDELYEMHRTPAGLAQEAFHQI